MTGDHTARAQGIDITLAVQPRKISAEQMRGVRERTPATRTTNWRGEYEKNPALREEFLVACGLRR
ncbi:MAG: hypothetical protein ACLQVA_14335 [Candidatus Brocadiia bacterium]